MTTDTATITPELLRKMDAYWRAANYLSVGQIYLYDNPLLKEPLKLSHVKPLVVGHWGTTPGQNFIYVHLNRIIKKYDLDMFYIAGPGHGGPAIVGNVYLEGTWSDVYPNVTQDEAGLKKLFTQFSFPGGISSHVAPTTPGSIHEGGELGYSLSHAFGAAFDNPDLVVACVVGDGEAETGPLATSWQSNKLLNPITDGVVLPILHLNGYKISNPTVLARIEHEELDHFFRGCGWTPHFVEGDDPGKMHQLMAATLDKVVEEIRLIKNSGADQERPHAAALADDRPQVPQGLDGARSRRRPEGRGHVPRAPGSSAGRFRASRPRPGARKLDEELPGQRAVRRHRAITPGAGRAGAQGRPPDGGQPACERRPSAAGPADAGLLCSRGERALAGRSHRPSAVSVRSCADLSLAVLGASSPHMFATEEETAAFERVRKAVGLPIYGGDCYAYGLIASGFHDLVIEANSTVLHDFLPLVPVIEGAGGIITDWQGKPLDLESGDKVLAAGDRRMHEAALKLLAWR